MDPLPPHPTHEPIQRLTFEVHGKVQGVFFRNHTVERARALGLAGFVANRLGDGAVVGEAEGPRASVAALRRWLEREGSPASRVDRVDATTADVPAGGARRYATFERRPNVP
jgi:acylphosphatase